jgi:hypothetical protein
MLSQLKPGKNVFLFSWNVQHAIGQIEFGCLRRGFESIKNEKQQRKRVGLGRRADKSGTVYLACSAVPQLRAVV